MRVACTSCQNHRHKAAGFTVWGNSLIYCFVEDFPNTITLTTECQQHTINELSVAAGCGSDATYLLT